MSTPKQQQPRRRINTNTTHQSRNTNAYIDRDEYHRRSLLNQNHYWNHDYHRSNDDFYLNEYYQYRNSYTSPFQHVRKGRQTKNEQQYNCKSSSSSNNNHALYYENIPPRHRHQQQQQHSDIREQRLSRVVQEFNVINKTEQMKFSNSSNNDEQPTKPLQSVSSSSTISEITHNVGSTNRKELHAKNLAVAAMAARQQSAQPQTNLGVVQTLMNSLILQQQQQQPVQAQSTVQLQYQLTNALLATMIQQRVKESVLQAQAQQIQAALPTLLAAQALVYQQQQQQGQITATLPPHVAHPGTKFNNRPLVKFAVARPTISSLPSSSHIQQPSTTTLPTYQQIKEIERGISLDQAIHLKNAIDIASVNNGCIAVEGESIAITNSHTIE
ncbi:hypothetical protein I4U23_029511 [Adineta vaga]|nr:hypothetical protein I4U23_029511 [Adineta vaga]